MLSDIIRPANFIFIPDKYEIIGSLLLLKSGVYKSGLLGLGVFFKKRVELRKTLEK